jgi:glycolate oxidase iron-sulfur subunit
VETRLAEFIRDTPAGREAEEILRRCVHCGFCNATCPTYQLLGDELDGPRGRIYLIKQVLEGATPTDKTRQHLDRCLHCRACETTCPSGVQYARLLDIGREVVEQQAPRRPAAATARKLLQTGLTRSGIFSATLGMGRMLKPLLPTPLRSRIPVKFPAGDAPSETRPRKFIALTGCVQPALYPNIHAAAQRVLDRLGIQLITASQARCCGAVRFHLDDIAGAKAEARRNIEAWWPLLEAGAEGLVMTASGCGMHVRDYAHLLQDDPYALRAARVALLTRDVSELVTAESARLIPLLAACPSLPASRKKLSFQSPCSLQHGQQVRGVIEPLLIAAGYELEFVKDSYLCCGSAGVYSLLQPKISSRLRENRLASLQHDRVAAIASANVGCMAHLQSGTSTPVRHWIELIDERLKGESHAGR